MTSLAFGVGGVLKQLLFHNQLVDRKHFQARLGGKGTEGGGERFIQTDNRAYVSNNARVNVKSSDIKSHRKRQKE